MQKNTEEVKDKVHLIIYHEITDGEQRYSSTLSLTSALDRGKWFTPRLFYPWE